MYSQIWDNIHVVVAQSVCLMIFLNRKFTCFGKIKVKVSINPMLENGQGHRSVFGLYIDACWWPECPERGTPRFHCGLEIRHRAARKQTGGGGGAGKAPDRISRSIWSSEQGYARYQGDNFEEREMCQNLVITISTFSLLPLCASCYIYILNKHSFNSYLTKKNEQCEIIVLQGSNYFLV